MVILCDFDETAADRSVATLPLDASQRGPLTDAALDHVEQHGPEVA